MTIWEGLPRQAAPDFSQSFIRYSYCINNPLVYTDPSGELSKFWKWTLNAVFTSVLTVVTGGAVPFAAVVSSWIVGTIDGLSDGKSFLDATYQGGHEACMAGFLI